IPGRGRWIAVVGYSDPQLRGIWLIAASGRLHLIRRFYQSAALTALACSLDGGVPYAIDGTGLLLLTPRRAAPSSDSHTQRPSVLTESRGCNCRKRYWVPTSWRTARFVALITQIESGNPTVWTRTTQNGVGGQTALGRIQHPSLPGKLTPGWLSDLPPSAK